jgi:hypothetical protein
VHGASVGGGTPRRVLVYRDAQRASLSDGLVFTPVEASYYSYMVLKWKPRSENTVDFRVNRRGHGGLEEWAGGGQGLAPGEAGGGGGGGGRVELLLSVRGQDVGLGEASLSEARRAELLRHCRRTRSDSVIVECAKVLEAGRGGGWEVRRHRTDKTRPNSLHSAWRSMDVMLDDVKISDLLTALGTPRPRSQIVVGPAAAAAPGSNNNPIGPAAAGGGGGDVAAVAAHYDRTQRRRDADRGRGQAEQRDEGIHYVRKINNFAKSALIDFVFHWDDEEAGTGGRGGGGGGSTERESSVVYTPPPATIPPVLLGGEVVDASASGRRRNSRRNSRRGGESFLRVHWVAVPKALRARRQ